jgi:hypothetical protein
MSTASLLITDLGCQPEPTWMPVGSRLPGPNGVLDR